MNRARKNLNAQNAAVTLELDGENHNHEVSLWLAAGAQGTVVLEVGNRSKPTTDGTAEVVEWAQIKLWNPLVAVNAAADNIAGAAGAQYVYASVIGAEFVRARKSTNDVLDCWATLTAKKGASNH